MPGIGKARSASVAATLRVSFTNISLGLVVGVCGGSPRTVEGDDILLGDVIISNRVVQADFGRQFSDSIHVKDTGLDSLARPSHAISSFLKKLSGLNTTKSLTDKTHQYLQNILEQDGFAEWQYPGMKEDKLYRPQYRHKHQSPMQCDLCRVCTNEADAVCKEALTSICEQLGCANDMLLQRDTKSRKNSPRIYQGVFASSDQVIKSALHRDKLRNHHKAIAFETEGAGVWDSLPTIIVKSVCDYADSHKNKGWQKYAAVSAAAATKALLEEFAVADDSSAQPRREADESLSMFTIPFNPNVLPAVHEFIGRECELAEISQALGGEREDELESRKVFVSYGLGGIGKTQIAAKYAHTHKHHYSAIIWIDGSTLDSVKSSLSNFGPRIKSKLVEPSTDIDKNARTVLTWLAQVANTDWLMIFDNVDLDIDAKPPDPQAYRIQDHFPAADHGSILITTRLQSVSRLGKNKRITKLSQGESIELIQQRLGRSVDGDESAEAVIQSLDGLPLALAMAASFMREPAMTFKAYQAHYETTWSELFNQQDEYPLQEYAQRPLLATWRLSYVEVERRNADAVRLLKLFSFFNNRGLNHDLLKIASELQLPADLDARWYIEICKSSLSFARPLRLLLQYSLIEQEAGEDEYTLHGVLHEWIHNAAAQGSQSEYQDFFNLAGHLLTHEVPSDNREANYWPTRINLAPHADTFGRRLKTVGKQVDIPPGNLHVVGSILQSCEVLSSAEIVLLKAVQVYERTQGQCETLLLQVVNDLGIVYAKQGKLNQAERQFTRALEGFEKASGPEHMSTLLGCNNLGNIYRRQDKLVDAERMLIRAAQGYEKALGRDHLATLTTIDNLASLYTIQEKYTEAEQMFTRSLKGNEKVLGQENTSTLPATNGLAMLYIRKGKLAEAEQILTRAFQLCEKTIGEDHTATLSMIINLGIVYHRQERLDKAEQITMRALQGLKKILGQSHPTTLAVTNNLGTVYCDQDRPLEAEQMYWQALKGLETAVGSGHLMSLEVVANIGLLYCGQGKLPEAEQMLKRALHGFEKTLGQEHTTTLTALGNLAVFYVEQGKPLEAEQILVRALRSEETSVTTESCHEVAHKADSRVGQVVNGRVKSKLSESGQ